MATVAAYDDGSSTESEYYFDPNEADEESAADAWLHAKDATIKQEVVDLTGDDIISKPLSAVSEELELPKGSEWSHEAVTGDGDAFAVEKALEMATHCGQEQREEASTADTLDSKEEKTTAFRNAVDGSKIQDQRGEKPVKQVLRTLKKKEEDVAAKPRIVSLTGRTTPLTVDTTKPVAVGLRKPLSTVVGAHPELEAELSVPRPGQKTSPSSQAGQVERQVESCNSVSRERSKSRPSREERRNERTRSPSRRRVEQSRSPSRYRSERRRSPSRHRTERREESLKHSDRNRENYPSYQADRSRSRPRLQPTHGRETTRSRNERSKSQPRRYTEPDYSPRRYQGDYNKTSPRYRRERSASRAKDYLRSRSRSPQSRQVIKTSGSRQHYLSTGSRSRPRDSSERPYRSLQTNSTPRRNHNDSRDCICEQSRSPVRPSRSYESNCETRRDRSRSRGGNGRLDKSNHDDQYKMNGSSSKRKNDEKILMPQTSTPDSLSLSDDSRHKPTTQSRVDASQKFSNEDESWGKPNAGKIDSRPNRVTVQINRCHGSSNSHQHQEVHPFQSGRPAPHSTQNQVLPNTLGASRNFMKRPRVVATSTPLHSNPQSKQHPRDQFARRVFKLKLQEADLNEKLSSKSLDPSEVWFQQNRRNGLAAEQERLEEEDYERFWQLYESTAVPRAAVERYQNDREYASRVVSFKQKEASLQEQQNLALSSEVAQDVRRRLVAERQKLRAENPVMFDKVMADDNQGGTKKKFNKTIVPRNANAPRQSANRAHHNYFEDLNEQPPVKRRALGAPNQHHVANARSSNARVVVGAALRMQSGHTPQHVRSRSNKPPWFLKG